MKNHLHCYRYQLMKLEERWSRLSKLHCNISVKWDPQGQKGIGFVRFEHGYHLVSFRDRVQHAISNGSLQILDNSEVSLGYDSSLKLRGHFLGHQVHGLLPCAGQPRQEVQILPYHWLHLHLLLGCQGEQGYLASKDEEESIYTEKECQA